VGAYVRSMRPWMLGGYAVALVIFAGLLAWWSVGDMNTDRFADADIPRRGAPIVPFPEPYLGPSLIPK
jgi:hypothetical protein